MGPEKWLNAFVRFIALLERIGNALGTLAFIWATVVVLGGFSAYLGYDFWVATAIVFLEGFRAFSRQNKSDDQLLFKTTGGIKLKRMELGSGSLYYANATIMTACLWFYPASAIIDRLQIPWLDDIHYIFNLVVLVILDKLGCYRFIGYMSRKESHILLQLCPPATLLIAVLSLCYTQRFSYDRVMYSLFPLWFVIYIFARFASLRDGCLYHKEFKIASRTSRAISLVVFIWALTGGFLPIGLLMLLGPLVQGNLQAPMALARIILSWVWLFERDIEVHDTENKNVKAAVKILYIMVMCQGILYVVACIMESLSFLFRRSLALGCDLVDKSGMKSVNLYYEQAYDTFLEESLFGATKKMGIVTFAVDSLNPKASRDKKRAAVRILDSFLRKQKTSSSNTELISLITTSTKAVTTLISMMGWTVSEDADIRLSAAKVVAHIAPYVQIVGIPGTMQKVYSLFDTQDQLMTQSIPTQMVNDNEVNINNQQVSTGSSSPIVNDNRRNIVDRQQTRHGSNYLPMDIERGNTLAVQASLTRATPNNGEGCSMMKRIHRFSQHIEKLRSIPQASSKEEEDSLPTLGMQILEGLANDLHNCVEINRESELLPKILGFISCILDTTAMQREKIATSSLKLVAKLSNIKGKIGITLRQEICENPFLIGNLAEILELEGSSGYQEQSKLAMHIICKIAIEKKTRQKIGTVHVIINKLVQEFTREDESSKPLRAEAAEALAMLALESHDNCSAMLDITGYKLIEDLANKLQSNQHIYPVAGLLHSLCENSRQLVLSRQGSKDQLLSTLTVVLGRIVDAEGKQMKALIGLASQICSIMSGGIAPIIEPFPDDEALVKKLVGELSAHKKPSPDEFSYMRRWLVELTVSIVESCPRYALIFRQHRMVEALSKVEQYMGLVFSEEAEALPAMVARAKELIGADTP